MRQPAGLAVAGALAAVLLLGSCGHGTTKEKESSMTPDQAYEATRTAVADLLDALAPGSSASIGEPDRRVPCGGVGGNEFTKIKAAVTGSLATPAASSDAAYRTTRDVLGKAGWTVDPPKRLGDKTVIGFRKDAGRGTVVLAVDNAGEVSAESTCLPDE